MPLTPEDHQFPDIKTWIIEAFCMHGLPVLCKTCWADRAAAIEGRWKETERYRKALLMAKEELVFGGDWENAKRVIDAALAQPKS